MAGRCRNSERTYDLHAGREAWRDTNTRLLIHLSVASEVNSVKAKEVNVLTAIRSKVPWISEENPQALI